MNKGELKKSIEEALDPNVQGTDPTPDRRKMNFLREVDPQVSIRRVENVRSDLPREKEIPKTQGPIGAALGAFKNEIMVLLEGIFTDEEAEISRDEIARAREIISRKLKEVSKPSYARDWGIPDGIRMRLIAGIKNRLTKVNGVLEEIKA